MNDTPTPITDITYEDDLRKQCKAFETELTAAREELKTYKRANKELRGDVVRFATHIAAVTEQRDRLAAALESLRQCISETRGKDATLGLIESDQAIQSLN